MPSFLSRFLDRLRGTNETAGTPPRFYDPFTDSWREYDPEGPPPSGTYRYDPDQDGYIPSDLPLISEQPVQRVGAIARAGYRYDPTAREWVAEAREAPSPPQQGERSTSTVIVFVRGGAEATELVDEVERLLAPYFEPVRWEPGYQWSGYFLVDGDESPVPDSQGGDAAGALLPVRDLNPGNVPVAFLTPDGTRHAVQYPVSDPHQLVRQRALHAIAYQRACEQYRDDIAVIVHCWNA